MATTTKIHLTPSGAGIFHAPGITAESAAKASEVLQENHEKFHLFFNDEGFHNHIVHHILTIYALNASPEEIQKQYDGNTSYQRPPDPIRQEVVDELGDYEKRKKYLGKEKHSSDFQAFYQKEIERLGWEKALLEHLFKGDEAADDMLVRLFMGFLHPLIHLGFGVEFKQPAIIAQGLAQTAAHENWLAPFFHGSEERAASYETLPTKSLVELLDEIREDKKLSTAAQWSDGNKLRDGVMKRAPEEMIGYASQWGAGPEELEEKTAEMINAVAYYTSAAQNPPKQVKLDFYYLHSLNSSIFLPTFLSLPLLSPAQKSRLITWKGRLDLVMYASRRSPRLLRDEVAGYVPRGGGKTWEELFRRVRGLDGDDGHIAKAVRALAFGEGYCGKFGGKGRMEEGMWEKAGWMALDSAQTPGPPLIRSVGFEKAWEKVQDREDAKL
ncbi:hypothetical protein FGG08_004287 [Glutinoglossum americanum]|uniref:HypA-like protein n=1 Tax=Glutinoglossum americanum TaxID=1670608 RepID=A0A9P8I9I2_9PEZI|nr:hypothetical protein FGG08_004287 [Glutinoglossum americanum]